MYGSGLGKRKCLTDSILRKAMLQLHFEELTDVLESNTLVTIILWVKVGVISTEVWRPVGKK
jgi:hypothetical protein